MSSVTVNSASLSVWKNLLSGLAAPTASSSADPSYGQAVSFNVSTNATTQPFVHVKCSQNGSLVYEAWQSWARGPQSFTLGGTTAWQSGAADCTAYLENWDQYGTKGKVSTLASTNFHVDG